MELFNLGIAVENFGLLLGGLFVTVELTLIVMILSLVAGFFVALGRMSPINSLRFAARSYIEVIRGTPLLLQLVYVFYVLPEIGIRLDAFAAGVLALTAHNAAYLSEVYRGSIMAVPRGQHEAASALGLRSALAMRLVILPQAIRIALPTFGNQFIALFKETSLCSVITIQEVLFKAEISAARNYQYFTLYTLVAVMYFGVSFPAARFVEYLEKVTALGYRRV